MTNSVTLKVKRKSLASESAIIRKSERGQLGYARYQERSGKMSDESRENYTALHFHRTVKLRRISRVAHLAHGFMKGMPYPRIEEKRHDNSETFLLSLANSVSEELSKFGMPELRNMTAKSRLDAVASWMNI